jgi:dienelactone hydrolase
MSEPKLGQAKIRGKKSAGTRRGECSLTYMRSTRERTCAHILCLAAAVLAASIALAAEPFRVLEPSGGASNPVVLLVPGCSGFVARNEINHYDERASELQAAGYFVVFVDYLTRRHLTNCAGGRDVSHAEVAADILEAAAWIKGQARVASDKIFVIGWSFGGGGVLAALSSMPSGPPLLAKAAMYYPDCRRALPWSSTSVSALMLMGAMDEVALPALCNRVIKGMHPNRLRAVLYPNARHGFDMRGLPDRAEFGRLGYNAEAAKASWTTVLEFLR